MRFGFIFAGLASLVRRRSRSSAWRRGRPTSGPGRSPALLPVHRLDPGGDRDAGVLDRDQRRAAAIRAGAIDLAVTYGGIDVYLATLLGAQAALPRPLRRRLRLRLRRHADASPHAAGPVARHPADADGRSGSRSRSSPHPHRRRDRAGLPRGHLPLGARVQDLRDLRLHLPRRRRLFHLRRARSPVAERAGTADRFLAYDLILIGPFVAASTRSMGPSSRA